MITAHPTGNTNVSTRESTPPRKQRKVRPSKPSRFTTRRQQGSRRHPPRQCVSSASFSPLELCSACLATPTCVATFKLPKTRQQVSWSVGRWVGGSVGGLVPRLSKNITNSLTRLPACGPHRCRCLCLRFVQCLCGYCGCADADAADGGPDPVYQDTYDGQKAPDGPADNSGRSVD